MNAFRLTTSREVNFRLGAALVALATIVGISQKKSVAAEPTLPIPAPLLDQCNPCRISADSYDLSYEIVETESSKFTIVLNNEEFNLEVDSEILGRDVLPFFKMEFETVSPERQYGFFGLLSSSNGEGAESYHYFYRMNDDFSYLGELPLLTYEEEHNSCVACERLDCMEDERNYYSLVGGTLLAPATRPEEREAWNDYAPYACNWRTERTATGHLLIHEGIGIEYPMEMLNYSGRIEILEEITYQNFDLIIYMGGAAGTNAIREAKYAAIFDRKSKQVRGIYPFGYRDITYNRIVIQPVWSIAAGVIVIDDVNTNVHAIVQVD